MALPRESSRSLVILDDGPLSPCPCLEWSALSWPVTSYLSCDGYVEQVRIPDYYPYRAGREITDDSYADEVLRATEEVIMFEGSHTIAGLIIETVVGTLQHCST